MIELTSLLDRAIEALLASAGDRIGAPYLLGALVIASIVWWRHARGRRSWLAFLFPKTIWWHRSARLDYALLAVRTLLDLTLLSALAVSSTAVSFGVARALWRYVGILPDVHVSQAWVIAGFSIAAFVAEDFARYCVHRAAHRIPAFWELHKLHHSAEVLTPFTIFRVHPIEGLLNAGVAALAVGVVAGIVSWIVPGKLAAWTISGIYALQYVWNVLGTNLRHSHVWLSYGARLEHVLISPAQHQIHHSSDPKHHDRNFGSALALWDWMFGSLYVTRERERLSFGLWGEEPHHHRHVIAALTQPLWRALRRLVPSMRTNTHEQSADVSVLASGASPAWRQRASTPHARS